MNLIAVFEIPFMLILHCDIDSDVRLSSTLLPTDIHKMGIRYL
jgi:hypothetical protein